MKIKILLTFLCIALTSYSFAQTKTIQNQKPNIIFILADDMGYGNVSALNHRDSKVYFQNHAADVATNYDAYMLLPIPQSEIDIDSKLTQNPGY